MVSKLTQKGSLEQNKIRTLIALGIMEEAR